jgi:hypothetical protein
LKMVNTTLTPGGGPCPAFCFGDGEDKNKEP